MLLVHPTGNANVRNAALALQEASLLREFWTCFGSGLGSWWNRLANVPGLGGFARRSVPEEIVPYMVQRPWREFVRLLCARLQMDRLIQHEVGYASIDAVYRDLDRAVAARIRRGAPIKAVYAYEDGALECFKAASEIEAKRIYDLPIGYWRAARRIFSEERERLPEWGDTMQGLHDSPEKLARKDEELALADQIVVASSFTAATLREAPLNAVEPIIIPYGCDHPWRSSDVLPQVSRSKEDPLKVLFVGSLTQRKGLYEVFRAVAEMRERVVLTVVGQPVGSCPERDRFLSKVNWVRTAPHNEILRLMREHDVLAFPSLFEGFGLVITEALSQGIPVITTHHTAGPDILTDGVDGFLVPIRSWESVVEKLEVLDRDRERLEHMKVRAREKASEFTWGAYRRGLAATVETVLDAKLTK